MAAAAATAAAAAAAMVGPTAAAATMAAGVALGPTASQDPLPTACPGGPTPDVPCQQRGADHKGQILSWGWLDSPGGGGWLLLDTIIVATIRETKKQENYVSSRVKQLMYHRVFVESLMDRQPALIRWVIRPTMQWFVIEHTT
jgi:hypothetical protein